MFALKSPPFLILFNPVVGEYLLPMVILLMGIGGACLLARTPQKKATPGLIILMLVLSLWPLLTHLGLFWLALELQKTSGHWPQVMVDDPKNWYGQATPLYDALFDLVDCLGSFSLVWFILFLTIFFAAKPKFSVAWRRIFIGLTVFWVIIFFCDPGNLFGWWLD